MLGVKYSLSQIMRLAGRVLDVDIAIKHDDGVICSELFELACLRAGLALRSTDDGLPVSPGQLSAIADDSLSRLEEVPLKYLVKKDDDTWRRVNSIEDV